MKLTGIALPDPAQILVLATACALQGAAWTLCALKWPAEPTTAGVLLAVAWATAVGIAAYTVPFSYLEPGRAWRTTIAIHSLTLTTALPPALL